MFNKDLVQVLDENKISSLGLSVPSAMNVIPFEALYLNSNKDINLGDKISIYSIPSIKTAELLTKYRSKKKLLRVLIIPYRGEDLLEAKNEVKCINELDNMDVHVFEGKEYSRNLLLKELKKEYDFIHFVCHGMAHPQNPDKSALILDSSWGDSAKLCADEIADINFANNPIITLSACSSIVTAFDNYNSMRGLSGSFFEAGALAIIGSKWDIFDDIGKNFMVKFYSNISKFGEKESVFDSFYRTQKELKTNGEIEDWTSFTYLGFPI